jgi:hypothetical protein
MRRSGPPVPCFAACRAPPRALGWLPRSQASAGRTPSARESSRARRIACARRTRCPRRPRVRGRRGRSCRRHAVRLCTECRRSSVAQRSRSIPRDGLLVASGTAPNHHPDHRSHHQRAGDRDQNAERLDAGYGQGKSCGNDHNASGQVFPTHDDLPRFHGSRRPDEDQAVGRLPVDESDGPRATLPRPATVQGLIEQSVAGGDKPLRVVRMYGE